MSNPSRLLFAGPFPHGGKLHRLWWHYSDHWAGDYLSVWRPLCWFLNRSHKEHYGACVICGKTLANDDYPTPCKTCTNPVWNVRGELLHTTGHTACHMWEVER